MAAADALVAQLRSQRMRWVTVREASEGVKPQRIQVEAPSMYGCSRLVNAMMRGDIDAQIEILSQRVRGWEGVTESDLLGAAVGGSGDAPCSPELAALVLGDRPAWVTALGSEVVNIGAEIHERLKVESGN